MEMENSDYGFRNLQAKIMARFLYVAYIHHKSITTDLFEDLSDKISDGEFA